MEVQCPGHARESPICGLDHPESWRGKEETKKIGQYHHWSQWEEGGEQ